MLTRSADTRTIRLDDIDEWKRGNMRSQVVIPDAARPTATSVLRMDAKFETLSLVSELD
jgi:hypothetical protein